MEEDRELMQTLAPEEEEAGKAGLSAETDQRPGTAGRTEEENHDGGTVRDDESDEDDGTYEDDESDDGDDGSELLPGERCVPVPDTPPRAKKRRRRIHEISAENDIKYRGPLSYRHFKILGWVCIIAGQMAVILRLGIRLDPGMADVYNQLSRVFQPVGSLALPLLLFANFAIILNSRDEYGKLLFRYAATVLTIMAIFLLFYERYAKGLLRVLGGENMTPEVFMSAFHDQTWSGYMAFNLFVDLFLCTLFMFFLNYVPKRLFKGKSLIFFRLMALLPIFYEAACIILKLQAGRGIIRMPVWLYPLLTTKPPLAFLMFTVLGLILKKRERRFIRRGNKTREEYGEFWNTNANSLHFSLLASLVIFITVLLDILLLLGTTVLLTADTTDILTMTEPQILEKFMRAAMVITDLGVGGCVGMILIIPLLLLFSFTRKHKSKLIDALIPAGGIILIIILYIESGYQVLMDMIPLWTAR